MSRSPAASRRLLGSQLRALREKAGKKIDEAAALLEYSTATISRLETGKGKPKTRDVRELLTFYGNASDQERERLIALATEAQEQDWLSGFRDVIRGDMFADHLVRFLELERDSEVLKQYEVDLIPGLLQTEEYIDAVCRAVYPENSVKERERFVQFRRTRQDVLRATQPPELSVIVSEIAIVRTVGGADVKKRQLEALVNDLSGELKDVDFRILPLTAGGTAGLGGPFCVLKFPDIDQNVVYLEGREGATYLETAAAVTRYEEKFSALENESLDPAASLQRMTDEIDRSTAA